ncbi:metallophosphoesterase [Candidatus Fermentibacteria bacterium]|nr:metallophosphoesterase [Candidatus Fermentibacteria bacterium]
MISALLMAVCASPARIAVLGDLTGGGDLTAFESCLETVSLMHPDVVVNVGDLIAGYTDDRLELEAQWEEVLGIIRSRIPGMEIVLVPGNHDITRNEAEQAWREMTGTSPDRVEEHSGVTFVVWDTSRMEHLDEAGLERLEGLLGRVGRRDTSVLLTHRPFWMLSGEDESLVADLEDLVSDADIEVVLGGHIHTYCRESNDGTEYITMCTSGGDFGGEEIQAGRFHQVGWLTLDGDGVSFALLDPRHVYPPDLNTVEEETLRYLLETRLLAPRLLEAALESAALTLNATGDGERTVHLRVDPQGWGLRPESLEVVVTPGEARTVYFSQNPGEALYPAPLLTVETAYGPRDKVAVFSVRWPVLRTLDAPEARAVVDGTCSQGEYPGSTEAVFAGSDGGADALPATAFRVSASGNVLFVHARMQIADDLDGEAFGLVLCAGGEYWRVKAFPDGGADAIRYSGDGYSSWRSGWEAVSRAEDGFWEAEFAVDLEEIGSYEPRIRADFYRLSNGGLAVWAWPLEFEERCMGIVNLEFRLP